MNSLLGSKQAEVFNKIVTGNKLVQYQAIEKIHSNLTQMATNEVEKRKLLNKLIETLPMIKAKNCSMALLAMLFSYCKEGHLDHSNLMSLLLNLVNSKQENSIYCLDTITQILIHFKEDLVGKYSVRNPSHPFIEILRNSGEASDNLHELVFQQIQAIYTQLGSDTNQASLLLKPVFIHVFLETSTYKHLVASYLIGQYRQQVLTQAKDDLISKFVTLYFTHLKPNEINHLTVLKSLHEIIKIGLDCNQVQYSQTWTLFIADFLIRLDLTHSFNCSLEWQLFTELIRNQKALVNDSLLTKLATNLSKIGLNNLEAYFDLTKECISFSSTTSVSKLSVAIFIPCLFEYLIAFCSLDSTTESTFSQSYKAKTAALLELATKLINGGQLAEADLSSRTDLFNFIEYEELDTLNRDPNEAINREKLNLLCACFILNESDLELTKKMAALFQRINKRWSFLSATFFAIYINKIKTSSSQQMTVFLLNTLIGLIVPKTDINMFLNIFVTLIESANTADSQVVRECCMIQLVRLCQLKHDHLVYPVLSRELAVKDKFLMDSLTRGGLLITKAYCIQEMIKYRPDYYAQELLASISGLINICSQKGDGGVCGVLIDTMAVLCESEVVDMPSTWQALYPQFRGEKRALALGAYCRFMATVACLDHLHKTDEQDSFYERIMKILWSMCSDLSSDVLAETTNAAFSALSKFNRTHFKCSYLPEKFQERLKERNKKIMGKEENKDKSIDEIFPQVPASCYLDMFSNLKRTSYKGFKQFMISALTEELDSIPRRLQNNREKVFTEDDQQTIQKNFFDLIKGFLVDETKTSLDGLETTTDSCSFILYCYEVMPSKNSSGKPMKLNAASCWAAYEKVLRLLLTKCSFQLTGDSLPGLNKGLENFLQKAFNANVQCLKFEYQNELDKNKNLSAAQKNQIEENIQKAWIKSRDHFIQILIEAYSKEVDANLYVLVIVTLAEIVEKYMTASFSTEAPDLYQLMHFNQSKWTEVLIDFLLNIKENKVSTKTEFLTTFSYNKIFPVETLKFLYEIFHATDIHVYFLAKIQPSCVQLKISSYLLQYLHTTQMDLFDVYEKNKAAETSKFTLEASSVYIQNLIKSTTTFDQQINQKINKLIQRLFAIISNLLRSNQANTALLFNNLTVLTDCLYILYAEESVFYDEAQVLVSFVTELNDLFKSKAYPFQRDEKHLYKSVTCLVNLTCLAYKSNLISNENLKGIFDLLETDNKFNGLLAFFCRFLVSFGYLEAVSMLELLHSKWVRSLNDFRLKLKSDQFELENTINGLLALLTGVSTDCLVFNQIIGLTAQTEKILKPESTIKEILKFFKRPAASEPVFENQKAVRDYMSYLFFNYTQFKYGAVFSVPENFDYLDELSILRQVFNETNRIIKDSNETESEAQFEFMITTLLASCRNSKVKSLPPVNLYFFLSSLLKSKFGKKYESKLIEIAMLQFSKSNSAYTLVKNLIIDTNYFNNLQVIEPPYTSPEMKYIYKHINFHFFKFESQLIILSSLNNIWCKLNTNLLTKYLNKLKIFLKQFETIELSCPGAESENHLRLYTAIFENCIKFSHVDREQTHQIYTQVVQFFYFICSELSFNTADHKEMKLVDLMVDVVVKFEDESLLARIISLEQGDLNEIQFLKIFYLKARLVILNEQPFKILNSSIQILLDNIDVISLETTSSFFQIFTNCMVKTKCLIELTDNNTKVNNIKTNALNWLIEFIGTVKSLTTAKFSRKVLEFSTTVFSCFIYSWSIQTCVESTDELIHIDCERICSDLHVYLKRMFKMTFWKQSQIKMSDWLMFIYNTYINNNCQNEVVPTHIKRTLSEVFVVEEWPTDLWFRFADIINKNTGV